MTPYEITFGGERVRLDPDRAAVCRQHLLVADVHLDKAATFQRAGLAVPLGDEAPDLARIARLAEHHDVRDVVVLGDLVHAPPRRSSPTETVFLRWCDAHTDLRLSVIVGNHDRDAAQRFAHWPVHWIEGTYVLGAIDLRHEPSAAQSDGYEIAGHLHPVLRLRDGHRDAARLPGFWQRARTLVLPAFGSFTGGYAVHLDEGECFHAIVEDRIIQVDARRARGRA